MHLLAVIYTNERQFQFLFKTKLSAEKMVEAIPTIGQCIDADPTEVEIVDDYGTRMKVIPGLIEGVLLQDFDACQEGNKDFELSKMRAASKIKAALTAAQTPAIVRPGMNA